MLFTTDKELTAIESAYFKFFSTLEVPDLAAFVALGLPIRQIVKVKPPTSE